MKANISILETVTPEELGEIIYYAFKTKEAVFIEGRTGFGKSRITHDVAQGLGIDLIDMRAILFDIGDLVMKIPDLEKRKMIEIVTEALPDDGEGILFLDEFKQAPVEIRRMFYQLILDRAIGVSYKLPDGWLVVSASNLDEEIDQEELEAPLFDRFLYRVRLENNLKEWKKWANTHGIHNIVMGFLEVFNDKFYVEDDEKRALMTPRRWEKISDDLHRDASDNIFKASMPGGLHQFFLQFRKQVEMFKDLDSYLSGKQEPPEELDEQYALATALVNKVKGDKDLVKILKSKIKLNQEVDVFLRLRAITMHRRANNKNNVDTLAAINRLPKDVRKLVIQWYSKLGYLNKAEDEFEGKDN